MPTVVRTDYDMAAVAAGPEMSEIEKEGQRLFVQRCALCHDPLGQPSYPDTFGPWLDQNTVEHLGETQVRRVIDFGSTSMPGWRYTLDASQVTQVIAYLKTVTHKEQP